MNGVVDLETARTEGLSGSGTCASRVTTSATRTITTEWHSTWRLPKRIAEPLKVTTFHYHGDTGVSCAPSGASTTLLCSKDIQATTDADGLLAFTRPSDNQFVWKWDNTEAFGNSAPDENPSGLGAFAYNLRFPGQYYDVETGLLQNYFRDYDSRVGRYIQSDLVGLEGGTNTYAYALDNPTLYVDPTGLLIDFGRTDFGIGFAVPIIGRGLGFGAGAGVTFRQCCKDGDMYNEAFASGRFGVSVGASGQLSSSGRGTFGVGRIGKMPTCLAGDETNFFHGLDFQFGPVSVRVSRGTLEAGVSPGGGASGTFNLGEKKWSLGQQKTGKKCDCPT